MASKFGILCEACARRDDALRTKRAFDNNSKCREAKWAKICPKDFLKTELERLPLQNKYDEVMQWRYGSMGLVLHGPTGTGKSRCMWLLGRREFDLARTVRALSHSFHYQYAALFTNGADAVAKWARGLITADLLLLDDVFKAKLTESAESALFSIVSSRTEASLPIIATLNDTGATLIARMSDDRGEAMIRRLREYAQCIPFVSESRGLGP